MRIAVFGAGGVGGYFGGRLALAGNDVVFIARGAHLQALREQGLRVKSIQGDFTVSPVQATDDPAQVGRADLILVAVKAWQIPEVALAIEPLMGPGTAVVPLQNGLEAASQLAEVLGEAAVLGGLCTIFSYIEAPGCIEHIGMEPTVTIGERDRVVRPRTDTIRQCLAEAGIVAQAAADINVPLWEKFLVLRWGIIGAVSRAPAGVLRSLPQLREMIDQAGREVLDVAQAHGVPLSRDMLQRNMELLEGLPPQATTSLQRDVMAGHPSEVDAQAGALVRLGQRVNVPTPLHTFLFHALLPLELKARGELQFSD
ncbi:ketopantoate reductase family protein [Candidatus Entotheonella palauensis]|nr:2-dehydropantoate 2-reductase [Candidatus Entotheonella palauensis]